MTSDPGLAESARCPCLSGETYGNCCGRFHSAVSNSAVSNSAVFQNTVFQNGEAQNGDAYPPTAERLMRSRFSAFAVGDARYLLATWHPSTKPATLDLDAATRWSRLDILATSRGGLLDTEGTVEFRAHYRPAVGSQAGGAGSQHEVSRFVRERGRWYYLDGVVADR